MLVNKNLKYTFKGTGPIHPAPCRQEPKRQRIDRKDMERMLTMNVIEPAKRIDPHN